MTVQSAQVAVSTTPVALGAGGGNGITLSVYNAGGPAVYLGGSSVAGTTGFQLGSAQSLANLSVERGDSVYAVTVSGTATVHVLRGGV